MDGRVKSSTRHKTALACIGPWICFSAAVCPAAASAQSAIERYPVPVAPSTAAPLAIDEKNYGSDDTKPFGVDLAGVALIGESDAVQAHPERGIRVAAAPAPAGREDIPAALDAALKPYLGMPLSNAGIAKLQAAVAGVYRANGLPFVSVTAPPQEVTDGVVQLRVIVFRLGHAGVEGAGSDKNAIGGAVRARSGEPIDADALSEDIDWLNRNPYRAVTGVFSQGEATTLSDLTLSVSEGKPWSVTAGWSNTGSAGTGKQRYSVGGGFWLPSVNGATVSYLLTGSGDSFGHPRRFLLEGETFPHYVSHAARVVIPASARQQIEFTPDLVASRIDIDAYTSVRSRTFELPLVYRTAVSNLLPGKYWGEIYGGLAYKSARRQVYFAGTEAASGDAALLQFTAGWADTFRGKTSQTAVDLRLVANPGKTVADSGDRSWSVFSGGRVTSASYAYGIVNLTRRTKLGGSYAWDSEFTGMLAGTALPDTERLALGGVAGSRGYGFYDASADRGAIWRNTLRMPGQDILAKILPEDRTVSPYVFADVAWGEDLAAHGSTTLLSAGAGMDIALVRHVMGTFTAGRAITDRDVTGASAWNVMANVSVTF